MVVSLFGAPAISCIRKNCGAFGDATAANVRECQVRQRRCECFVVFVHAPRARLVPEQCLILSARLRIRRQHHEAGGAAVDAVQRNELRDVELFDQSGQQRLARVDARRHHRKEVRLVGDHEVFVAIQHLRFERNRRFRAYFAEVVHAQAVLIRPFGLDRTSVGVEHHAAAHAFMPLVARNSREARTQRIEHGRPVAARQMHRAGRNAVARQ